ncbi:hypothetical protein LOTGIDRAFT_75744, partial [Lottia gigantea]
KIPVVLLLGWAGSLDKHLAKYSAIYEQRRCITVRYTAPSKYLYFNHGKLARLAKGVLDTLYDRNLEDHPIFIHMFSNGGCYVYYNICHLVHNDSKYHNLRIEGSIFDSAPGKRRILKAAKAFMAMFKVNFVLKYLLGLVVVAYLLVSCFIFRLMNLGSSKTGFLLYESIQQDPGRWPQMFLYSVADEIVSYKDIEQMAKSRKKVGVQVTTNCWNDSPHVAHFPRYTESYSNLCQQFLDSCLK